MAAIVLVHIFRVQWKLAAIYCGAVAVSTLLQIGASKILERDAAQLKKTEVTFPEAGACLQKPPRAL